MREAFVLHPYFSCKDLPGNIIIGTLPDGDVNFYPDTDCNELISSCLRQVPPPCQPSTLGDDCSNDGGDDDIGGDDNYDGDDDDDDVEEEGFHMWLSHVALVA